jgi:hypothetical protein
MLLCGLSWTRRALREEEPRKNSSSASMISSGRDGDIGFCCSWMEDLMVSSSLRHSIAHGSSAA